MRRPSIFYRIKSKQGEFLHLLLIAESFGEKNYYITIKGSLPEFNFMINDLKQRISVSSLSKLCVKELNSEEFKVNNCDGPDNENCQNMCDLIPKLYGNETKTLWT